MFILFYPIVNKNPVNFSHPILSNSVVAITDVLIMNLKKDANSGIFIIWVESSSGI